MANNVKGITVEIGGDTTKLGKALSDSEKQSRNLQKELKSVNTALKFNPDNVELLTQKQKLLTDQIEATKEKLETLKAVEAQVTAQFNAGEIGEEQFREFQREIIETESKLKTYQAQLEATSKKASSLDELTKTMTEQEDALTQLKNEYKDAVLMYGKNSDEAKKLAGQITTLSKELKDNKTKMSELDKAADDLDQSLEETEASAKKAGEGFTVMKGVLADLAATAIKQMVSGLTELAKKTFEAGMNFEAGMSQVAAVSGATGEELDALTEKAKEMGAKTKFSASQSAEAFNYMAMAGWKTEDMLNGIEGIMNLAAASGEDLATTSDIVTDALTAMGYSAGDAGKLADVMAAASSNANTNVKMMGQTFQYAAPIVGALGYSMEDTAVAIGLMANAGIKADKAGTALRSMLTRLSAPPKECADAMDALGISLTDSEGNMKSLDEVMGDLRKAFDGLSETEQTAYAKHIAGQEAMSGLLAIVNAAPADYAKLTKAVQNSNGAAQKMADTMNDNVAGALTLLKSNIESKMIKVFDHAKGSIKSSVESMSSALDSLDWDKIGEGVGRFAEKIAKLFNYVVENAETVKRVLAGVGTVIGTVFVVNKVANFAQSILTLSSAFSGLWAVMLANPITLVIAAAAGLTAATIALNKVQDDQIKKTYGLNEEEKKLINSINSEKTAIEQATEARKKSNAAIDSEAAQNSKLWDELQDIVDVNGKIKEGYEDRASVITGLLAESLGIEIEIVDGQIQKYGELKQSIEEVIRTKRAEALLEANKQAYADAISNQAAAYSTYTKAVKEAQETQAELTKAEERANEIRAQLTDGSFKSEEQIRALTREFHNANIAVDTLSDKYDEQSQAVEAAEKNYFNYASTIQNYEGLMAAIANGDVEELSKAMDRLSANFMNAETATREMLEGQLSDFKDQYAAMKEAVEAGMPGVTQANVDAMADLVKQAESELDKLPPKAEKAGKKTGDAHASGLGSTSDKNEQTARNLANKTDQGLDATDTKKTGKKKGEQYAEGIKDSSGASKTAAKTVSESVNSGMGSADTKNSGKKKGEEFASGVKGTSGAAMNAGKDLSNSTKKGSESVSLAPSGKKEGDTFVSGVSSKNGSANSAGKGLANNAKSGAGSVSAYNSGSNFGQGFINGIGSLFSSAFNKAKELAKKALAGIKAGQKEGSPSKLTYQSGIFFDEGYINAIRDKTKEAVKAAREMAKQTVAALGEESIPDPLFNGPNFNGATFGRQLESTFNGSQGPDFSAIIDRIDALEDTLKNIKSVIVLDTGTLVGETINQIDSGLADVYGLKARGI